MTNKFNFFLLLIFSACHTAPTGKQIVERSIAFHDPEGKWHHLQQKIQIKSDFVYPDSAFYKLEIGLDNLGKRVSYANTTLGQYVDFTGDSCEVILGNKTCEQAAWTRNFYHFIMGLPMTLQNDEGKIKDALVKTSFHQMPSYRVEIDFVKEKWHFYFSESNYQLIGFAFDKNFEEKAEEIQTEGLIEVDGMKLCKMRSWWITTDSLSPIYSGKDEIINSENWEEIDDKLFQRPLSLLKKI